MILKDISLNSPEENINYDELLLTLAEKGNAGEALRFWESAMPFIVLGRAGKLSEDVKLGIAQKDNIPILRRASGGGAVLQGKGCLNYCLILSKERDPLLNDLRKSYRVILNNIISAFSRLDIQAVFHPISDLALAENNKKFSGNAQRRSKKFILHHGTVLYDFDLGLINRYLHMPKDKPEYRRNRPHEEFVANVSASAKDIKEVLMQQFNVNDVKTSLNDFEKACLNDSVQKNSVAIETEGVLCEA